MIQHISISRVLVALGIVLLIAPALAPVQAMHFHDTGAGTTANGTELEEHGVRVVAYADLSERLDRTAERDRPDDRMFM